MIAYLMDERPWMRRWIRLPFDPARNDAMICKEY